MRKFIFLFFAALLYSCGASPIASKASVRQTAEQMEKEEFDRLMKEDSINKNKTVAESLGVLLNEDPNEKKVSLLINNNSECNIILRFAGEKFYNLPIYKNNKNFILIEKGTYSLGANLCKARYSADKTFTDSVTMTLSESD